MDVTHDRLSSGRDVSGSTATTAFVTPTHVIIGNVGDSRSVFVSGGQVKFASEDHKPSNEREAKRIVEAGGYLQMGRVCGNLAVSRALGDFTYKDTPHLPEASQKVSAEADVTIIPRSVSASTLTSRGPMQRTDSTQPDDEYLILACDGIWDVSTSEAAREFVTDHLKVRLGSIALAATVEHTTPRPASPQSRSASASWTTPSAATRRTT